MNCKPCKSTFPRYGQVLPLSPCVLRRLVVLSEVIFRYTRVKTRHMERRTEVICRLPKTDTHMCLTEVISRLSKTQTHGALDRDDSRLSIQDTCVPGWPRWSLTCLLDVNYVRTDIGCIWYNENQEDRWRATTSKLDRDGQEMRRKFVCGVIMHMTLLIHVNKSEYLLVFCLGFAKFDVCFVLSVSPSLWKFVQRSYLFLGWRSGLSVLGLCHYDRRVRGDQWKKSWLWKTRFLERQQFTCSDETRDERAGVGVSLTVKRLERERETGRLSSEGTQRGFPF